MEKKLKEVEITFLEVEYFSGSVEEVSERILSLKDQYKEYQSLRLSAKFFWDDVILTLYGSRLETDAEFEKRKKSASVSALRRKKKKLAEEEKERKQLKKLLKKYPDVVPSEK